MTATGRHYAALGAAVRAARLAAGLTSRQLAWQLGTTGTRLGHFECGRRCLSPAEVAAAAQSLNADAAGWRQLAIAGRAEAVASQAIGTRWRTLRQRLAHLPQSDSTS